MDVRFDQSKFSGSLNALIALRYDICHVRASIALSTHVAPDLLADGDSPPPVNVLLDRLERVVDAA